jgi:hypothetical protein
MSILGFPLLKKLCGLALRFQIFGRDSLKEESLEPLHTTDNFRDYSKNEGVLETGFPENSESHRCLQRNLALEYLTCQALKKYFI